MTESILSNLHSGEAGSRRRTIGTDRSYKVVSIGLNTLVPRQDQGVLSVVVLPSGDNQLLSSISAANALKTLEGVEQENPAQIQALLQQAPRLVTLLAQAVRGLGAEFGHASFRLRIADGSLVLAVQSYDEVKEATKKLEMFEDVFWATRSENEPLLTLTIDFLTRSNQ